MTLVKYQKPDLFRLFPLDSAGWWSDEVDRLFEESFHGVGRLSGALGSWAPAVELREDKDDLVATVELPGLKKENIDVSVYDGVLTISGERTRETKPEAGNAYRSERFYGRFQRSISLPKSVKAEAAKANYKDGVLTVTLPKTDEAKPKQIEVNVG